MRNACQFRRGPKFGHRGNTHRKQHQRQQLSPQEIHPPEGGVQMAVAPGYSSQPVLQIQLCNQGQNQFQSPATPIDFAAVNCWPMQNMQIQNTSSQSQTPANTTSHVLQHAMQGNERYGYMQNDQEYNQLWQYYQQQQQQLQLQQHYIQLQQQSFQQGLSQQQLQHSLLEPLQPQQLQQQVLQQQQQQYFQQQQPLQQEHPENLMQQQQPSTQVHQVGKENMNTDEFMILN